MWYDMEIISRKYALNNVFTDTGLSLKNYYLRDVLQ